MENRELTVSYCLVQFIIIGLWGIAKNLSWVDFSCLYILGFILQLPDWTTLPLMYDGVWILIVHWGQGS